VAACRRGRFRQYRTALFDEVDLHHAAADAADQFATRPDGHLVTLPARAAPGTLGNDKQHYRFVFAKSFADELPELEFIMHQRILPQRRGDAECTNRNPSDRTAVFDSVAQRLGG